jgi:hypothetical protein
VTRGPLDATFLVVVLLDGAAIVTARVSLPARAVRHEAAPPIAVSLQSVVSFVRGAQNASGSGPRNG